MECLFHISDECHEVKKQNQVCKACWNIASDQKKEEIKAHMPNFCTRFGCWNWQVEGATFCKDHGGLKRPRQGAPPAPIETHRRFNVSGKDTLELMELIRDCNDELMKRHKAGQSSGSGPSHLQ